MVAFADTACIASGPLADVAAAAWRRRAEAPMAVVLAFDRATAQVVELDLRGSETEVRARYAPPAQSPVRRGRPKLGVVAREVTLLPRHWAWLAEQPGGASVALRRLVDAARQTDAGRVRQTREVAYRFMSAMAGDLPGFEEAARALFGGDSRRLEERLLAWPGDIAGEIRRFLDGPQRNASS
ncbi:MAG: DUF2239 family protein [Alphaproteobacteria bacterium]|nr:DUF2239 family protein [Alphaproteobacteria bacterium]